MSELLDEEYLTWLYSQVGSVKTRDQQKTYWSLFRALFTKEFVWIIPNDDNRVEEGKYLRNEFMEDHDWDEIDPDWFDMGCSMLEMLIALSRRLSFEAGGEPREWFFELLENLGLYDYTDSKTFSRDEVEDVLDSVIWRTYAYDGTGGLFPLQDPGEDQREVEIWYQLNAYIMERA